MLGDDVFWRAVQHNDLGVALAIIVEYYARASESLKMYGPMVLGESEPYMKMMLKGEKLDNDEWPTAPHLVRTMMMAETMQWAEKAATTLLMGEFRSTLKEELDKRKKSEKPEPRISSEMLKGLFNMQVQD